MPDEMTRCPACGSLRAIKIYYELYYEQRCAQCRLPFEFWPVFDRGRRAIGLIQEVIEGSPNPCWKVRAVDLLAEDVAKEEKPCSVK